MAFPPRTLSTADALLSKAVSNAGYSESLRTWYQVSLALKDRSLFAFEGKEVQGAFGDPRNPPWEALILWIHREGGYVAGRGWTRGTPQDAKIWKAARVNTVGEALNLWRGSPVVSSMAEKLRLQLPDADV